MSAAFRARWLPVAGVGAVAIAIVCFCAATVDFKPTVSQNFFFSSDDPQFQADRRISEYFPQPTQVVYSVRGDLLSDEYLDRMEAFSDALESVPGVFGVQSLTSGPRDLDDARKSPLWGRLVISQDETTSNVFVFLEDEPLEPLIHRLKAIRDAFQGPDFALVMSGVPYITELIRDYLIRDLRVFGVAALFVFGVMVLVMFRSWLVVFGMMVTCITASALTLILTQVLNIRIGVLTANLATIVVVLTLSHLVFITFNWRLLVTQGQRSPSVLTRKAVRMTLAPSFWSMFTTLLGFVSLMFVQAAPLRRLGTSGVVGTLVGFVVAYLMYPWVLRARSPRHMVHIPRESRRTARRFFALPHRRVTLGLTIGALLMATGWSHLNTDPSLLSYFSRGSELRQGLEYIDSQIGSSPLKIVVRDRENKKLNSTALYQRLWALHRSLEENPDVGNVLSLPIIMAEARRAPLAFLLPWEWLLELLEQPYFDEIGKYFVTNDRRLGLFVLLMRESERREPRVVVIDRLLRTVRHHGFIPELVGGVYMLQGKLAQLVLSSLLQGLAVLLVVFLGLIWILTHSWRAALAVTLGTALIPVWLLGILGYFRLPFDVIAAPAANLAIAMGVDATIHLIHFIRRRRKEGVTCWRAWVEARCDLWRPIIYTAGIICAGFAIFGLSAFPPTQRFGLSVVLGTIFAPLTTLFLVPWLASVPNTVKRTNP